MLEAVIPSYSFFNAYLHISLSLPDPVFMLEQHWLKPENIVNNLCIYAGSNASAK